MICSPLPARWDDAGVCWANTGGPRSRTRVERIASTLLGFDGGFIRCSGAARLGLLYEDNADPVEVLERLLAGAGFTSPEKLRQEFAFPLRRLLCRPLPNKQDCQWATAENSRQVLKVALMLGLCTAQLYDPARPVLWTPASLSRGLELFDPVGFYA